MGQLESSVPVVALSRGLLDYLSIKSQALSIKKQTMGSAIFSFSLLVREESVSKVFYSINISEIPLISPSRAHF